MKTLPITLIAVALAFVAAPPGRADADPPPAGVAAARSGPKDYSKNAATGDHRLLYADGVRTSSLAGTTSATVAERASPVAADDPAPPAGGNVLTAIVAGLAGVALGAGGTAAIASRQ
jgi:hypothetical protein